MTAHRFHFALFCVTEGLCDTDHIKWLCWRWLLTSRLAQMLHTGWCKVCSHLWVPKPSLFRCWVQVSQQHCSPWLQLNLIHSNLHCFTICITSFSVCLWAVHHFLSLVCQLGTRLSLALFFSLPLCCMWNTLLLASQVLCCQSGCNCRFFDHCSVCGHQRAGKVA